MDLGDITPHVSILVCDGGYLVLAHVRDPEGDDPSHGKCFSRGRAVFTSLDLALKYAERCLLAFEGPADSPDSAEDVKLPNPKNRDGRA